MTETTHLTVTSEHTYPVIIGAGVSDQLPEHLPSESKVVLCFQPSVAEFAARHARAVAAAGHAVELYELADAEATKTIEQATALWTQLGQWRFGRGDVLVAVGGGAATDFVGFVAATWLRGVRTVYVPTTVAGMVDAAVGGKTGVNSAAGKNLIGAFWSPQAVLADLTVLSTLPAADYAAGLAEVLKCGLIADTSIIETLQREPQAVLDYRSSAAHAVISRAIKVKADLVAADFRESFAREALNFGHTFGHAIERVSGYTWRHGDAVAVGMVFAAQLHALTCPEPEQAAARHVLGIVQELLPALALPGHVSDMKPAELLAAMGTDKKVRDGMMRFVVVPQVGHTGRLVGPSETQVRAAIGTVVV